MPREKEGVPEVAYKVSDLKAVHDLLERLAETGHPADPEDAIVRLEDDKTVRNLRYRDSDRYVTLEDWLDDDLRSGILRDLEEEIIEAEMDLADPRFELERGAEHLVEIGETFKIDDFSLTLDVRDMDRIEYSDFAHPKGPGGKAADALVAKLGEVTLATGVLRSRVQESERDIDARWPDGVPHWRRRQVGADPDADFLYPQPGSNVYVPGR